MSRRNAPAEKPAASEVKTKSERARNASAQERRRRLRKRSKKHQALPHAFIQRVEVGERAQRYDWNAQPEIWIYYRDIGLVDEMPKTMTA